MAINYSTSTNHSEDGAGRKRGLDDNSYNEIDSQDNATTANDDDDDESMRSANHSFNYVDWGILIALAAIDAGLYFFADPFNRFVNKSMMEANLMYPLNDDTVPFWVVPIVAALVPAGVFLLWPNVPRHQRFTHVRGVLFAVLLAGVLTDSLKTAIGRPRPNFFWRCFPSGDESFDETTGEALCNGISTVIQEGFKSFPSGHASWSFAGLGFFSMYLNKMLSIKPQHKNNVGKLLIIAAPIFIAISIAISRVDDYMHHWQDVSIGAIIGLATAIYSFNKLCLQSFTQALDKKQEPFVPTVLNS